MNSVVILTGNSKVEFAISVKIGCGHRIWGRRDCGVDPLREGAIAVTQQHGNHIRSSYGNNQVKVAVAIEITDGHELGMRGDGIIDAGLKRPIAVAQKNGNDV